MVEEKENLISKAAAFFKSNFTVIGEACAAIVAVAASVLGFVNVWDTQTVISVFCALIAFLIFYFITQHKNISKIQNELCAKFDTMEKVVCNSANPDLDGIFYQNNEVHESEIIKRAKKQLVLVQETGNLIIERNKDILRKFLHNGGKLTIIVCADDKRTQSYLAFRSADLRNGGEINIRLQNFLSQIQSTVEPTHDGNLDQSLKRNVVIRYCPYPVAITAVYSPDEHLQAAVVRHSDFKASYQNKISLLVETTRFPRLYEHYQQQIENYFRFSYKKILITGKPHVGKTTLLKEMLSKFQFTQDMPIYYVYTEEIVSGGRRIGYQIVSSQNPIPRCLATRDETARPLPYDVNIDLLNCVADELKAQRNKILVVDEIGLMQMRSLKFSQAIFDIMNTPNCVLIGTVTQDSARNLTLEGIKSNLMCECIEYTRDNHDALLRRLKSELASALSMYPLVKEQDYE